MNRKGDLPTYFLIFVALLLSGMAVYTFSTADAHISKNPLSSGVYVVQSANVLENVIEIQSERVMKEIISKSNDLENTEQLKKDFIIEMKKNEIRLDNTNFYGRVRNGEFEIQTGSGEYILSVRSVFVRVDNNNNEVSIDNDLILKFDSLGNLID